MDKTLLQIISHRLASHWLVSGVFKTPYDVVQHMGAMQAQDIPQATRAVWSRIAGSSKSTIKKALSDGSIVRTRPMRGTLHYLAPERVHWMLDLCASKTLSGFAKRREFLGITDVYAQQALELMSKALRWWKCLTRTQMGQMLQDGWIPMQTQRVYHLACYAATRKLICFGPPTDKEETFVLLDERIPNRPTLTHEAQLAELARMYIAGHGPATTDDLARWTGLGKWECKKAFALVADEFQTISYQDKLYYYQEHKTIIWSHALLLAGFDEYFLGYKDRSIVADMEHFGKLFTSNGIFFPLVMIDGRIVGTWKRAIKKNTMDIVVTGLPGVKLSKDVVQEQAQRYAWFRGIEQVSVQL